MEISESQRNVVIPIRSNKYSLNVELDRILFDQASDFQRITIAQSECFGKILLLDGHIQFTDLDEFAYHEALVHVPAASIDGIRSALVVGGGDGGVLRELTKYASIERIDMVEIDSMVIEACQEHLPNISNGAFDDPRVNLLVSDAFPFVKAGGNGPYDLIVLDSTDTYEDEEGEISEQLFTSEFYEDCKNCLSDQGLVVTQSDNLVFCPYSLDEIETAFGDVFEVTGSYWSLVPSFGSFSGFCWASDHGAISKSRILSQLPKNLRYLNATTLDLALSSVPFGN